jgi:hypothetical protein
MLVSSFYRKLMLLKNYFLISYHALQNEFEKISNKRQIECLVKRLSLCHISLSFVIWQMYHRILISQNPRLISRVKKLWSDFHHFNHKLKMCFCHTKVSEQYDFILNLPVNCSEMYLTKKMKLKNKCRVSAEGTRKLFFYWINSKQFSPREEHVCMQQQQQMNEKR